MTNAGACASSCQQVTVALGVKHAARHGARARTEPSQNGFSAVGYSGLRRCLRCVSCLCGRVGCRAVLEPTSLTPGRTQQLGVGGSRWVEEGTVVNLQTYGYAVYLALRGCEHRLVAQRFRASNSPRRRGGAPFGHQHSPTVGNSRPTRGSFWVMECVYSSFHHLAMRPPRLDARTLCVWHTHIAHAREHTPGQTAHNTGTPTPQSHPPIDLRSLCCLQDLEAGCGWYNAARFAQQNLCGGCHRCRRHYRSLRSCTLPTWDVHGSRVLMRRGTSRTAALAPPRAPRPQ